MVHNYIHDDPLNLHGLRNINNTPRYTYNCGGYALGTFSWYCPFGYEKHYNLKNKRAYERIEKEAINQMLKEIPALILIDEEKVKARDFDINRFTIIAFRFSRKDFHYYKLGKNWRWYDKCGSTYSIHHHKFNEVWNKWGDSNQYDGRIYFFLKAR